MERRPGFRELKLEKWWGATVETVIDDREFEEAIRKASIEENFTYNGCRPYRSEGVLKYCFSQYPRRKFGPVSTINELESALKTLAELCKGKAFI